MAERQYNFLDKICLEIDQFVRALTDNPKTTAKSYPAQNIPKSQLTDSERDQSAALMRINHAGEICAQALYQGQSLGTRNPILRVHMQEAAMEEGDHLYWCRKRLDELNSHSSYLNPLWYIGSFSLGLLAGVLGDKWSLGFVAETEKQVSDHLRKHLHKLSKNDAASYEILTQMMKDEEQHRYAAIEAGARDLPEPVKLGMTFTSKLMVWTAYWV